MNKKYHELIENSQFKTIECGKYRYPRTRTFGLPKFLFPEKHDTWKLPMRMFDQGLFVIGDSWRESRRLQFTNFYAKSLLDNGVRVIYITDSLSKKHYDAQEQIESFIENIGLNNLKENEIHKEELSGDFNPDIFDQGVKLSIVRSQSGGMRQNEDEQDAYTSNVVALLNKIANSGIARYERGLNNPEVVVVLEEYEWTAGLNANELERAICLLKGKGFGVVVSCNDTKRFKGIVNSFGHYAFFRMDDPIEEIYNHDFFYPNPAKSSSDTESEHTIRADARDFKDLRAGECHYITRKPNSTDVVHCFGIFTGIAKPDYTLTP